MSHIIEENLFEKVLLEPAKELQGFKDVSLDIVSGNVTEDMAKEHMDALHTNETPVSRIRVVAGMLETGGWRESTLRRLEMKIVESNLYGGIDFNVRISGLPYHAKAYVWLAGGNPLVAFLGSANYTLQGFGRKKTRQIEAMVDCIPADEAHRFFKKAWCSKAIG